MAEPANLPEFDTNETNSLEYDQTHKDDGWPAPEGIPKKPKMVYFNYWMNLVYKWIKHLSEKTQTVDSIADLRSIAHTPFNGQVVQVLGYYAASENRDWRFKWVTGDFSSEVAADPLSGIYVAATAIPATTGAFVRLWTRDIVYVDWWGANTIPGVTDMTAAIQASIDYVNPGGRQNPFPDPNRVKATVKFMADEYKISSSINIRSYIRIEGAGKQLTRVLSSINDGTPIFNIEYTTPATSQEYVEVLNITIGGDSKNSIGIYSGYTNRFLLQNVLVMQCNHGGLVLYDGFINTIDHCDFWGNGDATHDSILLDGPLINFGPNATTFYSCEVINGGGTGLHIKECVNVNIMGACTFQSNHNGPAIKITNGLKILIDGNYFEQNLDDILVINGVSNVITNNIFTLPYTGYTACIVINALTNGDISLNEFQVGVNVISDTTAYGSLIFNQCHIGNNFGTVPLNISAPIMAKAKDGTVIERWDGSSYGYAQYGDQIFMSEIRFNDGIYIGTETIPRLRDLPGIKTFGNVNAALVTAVDNEVVVWDTALTADRTITLDTVFAREGDSFRIVRAVTATGAFNLNVGSLKALGAGSWCDVTYDGSAWVLIGYGLL